MAALPNILGRTREMAGDVWIHRYASGLVVHTDPFMRRDMARVLPIGGPQDVITNRLASLPALVSGKRVLDVFAGSGVFGLVALKLGAAHVDFVDINPRAIDFIHANAERNGFAADRYDAHLASIADFATAAPCDLLLANPPFVMTPPGIEGTLTSRAGAEGNDLVLILLDRLESLLATGGEAYVYVLQFVRDGAPLIAGALAGRLDRRAVAFVPVQETEAPLDHYVDAYLLRFPAHADAIRAWEANLRAAHGNALGVQHYVMHVKPRDEAPVSWTIARTLEAEYGEGFAYPASALADLALGRVAENLILPEA